MKKSLVVLVASVTIATGMTAHAEKSSLDLVDATGLAEQLTQARETCETTERAGDIESIALANPAMFQGVGPSDRRWADAREAYVQYAVSTCVPQNIPAYVDIAASLYDKTLSREEMLAIIAFYKSDAGKKFGVVSSQLSSDLNKKMYEERQEVVDAGRARFESEIQEISQRP